MNEIDVYCLNCIYIFKCYIIKEDKIYKNFVKCKMNKDERFYLHLKSLLVALF